MGGLFGRFLSFEEPMGPVLTRILYYLALAGIVWIALRQVWFWITHLGDAPGSALWALIQIPVFTLLAICVVRVITEVLLSVFRIDKSTHEQVTGRSRNSKPL